MTRPTLGGKRAGPGSRLSDAAELGWELGVPADAITALNDVAVAAGLAGSQKDLAELVVDRARVIAGGEGAVLRWFDPTTNAFQLLASKGVPSGIGKEIAATEHTAIAGAFKDRQPVIVNDYQASAETTSWGRRHRIRAQVAVPLLIAGRPVGTLAVVSYTDHQYQARDALFLSLLAAIVAPALEASRLAQEVRRQADVVKQVYDALAVAVIVFDGHGIATHHNSAALAALGPEALARVRSRQLPLYHEDGKRVTHAERPSTRALATRRPVRGTIVGFDRGGRRWAYVDAVPIVDASGDVDGVVTSSMDITSLKAAEGRLRLDSERLRRLIAVQAEVGNPELTAQMVMDLVSARAVELTGAAGAAIQLANGEETVVAAGVGFGHELKGMRFPLKGNPLNGCIADGGPESTSDGWVDPRCDQRAMRTAGIRSLVMAPIRHDGRVIGGLQLQSPEPEAFAGEEAGTLELLAGFAGAAISKARAAEAMRESEELFSGAFQASGVGMAMTALDGSLVRANPSLCGLFGYAESELVGPDLGRLVFPEDLHLLVKTMSGLYETAEQSVLSCVIRAVHRDGHLIWVRITASMIRRDGRPQHVLVHIADVTEERRAEAILTSERERLGEIIEAQHDLAGSEVDVDALLHLLAERTIRLTGAGAVAVLVPKDGRLVVSASAGEPVITTGYTLPIEGSLAGLSFKTGRKQQIADAWNDPHAHTSTAKESGLRAMISQPLMSGGKVIGILQLMSVTPGALDETDVRTLEMIAGFAAAAFDRSSATARLQSSERRTRAVIESAPYPIVIFDTNSAAIVEFNPAAERAFGRARTDVIGQSTSTLVPAKRAEAFGRWLREGRSAGTAEYAGRLFENTGIRADGSEFPIEIAIADLPEEIHLAGAFIRDLSMRERLRETNERLAAVIADARVILFACDREGRVTLSEGKGMSVLGIKPEDIIGHDLRELLASQPDAIRHLERALSGDSFRGQIHLAEPDLFLEGTYSPIRDETGAFTGVSAILTDVTDRVRADTAQRESEAKTQLMAMMNHEVRTPLNSILGFAQLLAEPKVGELNDLQRRYLNNVEIAGRQLLALVNDSLDLAKLKAGHMEINLEDLQVDAVLERAADTVRPLAVSRGLVLQVDSAPELFVRADARHLGQVVLNLLSNAIRHTAPPGTVRLCAGEDSSGAVLIRVIDTGQGIPHEDLELIFEEFFQSRNHAAGGTGLGLTISRRLMQLMSGSISVTSEMGKGSYFTLRLDGHGAGATGVSTKA